MKLKTVWCVAAALALLALVGSPAIAEHHETEMPTTGFEGSFARDLERTTKKLFDLADAIPADKFGWRPTEEVRTVSESLIHVAGANFFISSSLGVAMPEGFGRDAEQTITAKADVMKTLKDSFKHVEMAMKKNAGTDMEEEIELFGSKRAKRDAFMILTGHAHEHLGQLIVYARSNGIVPPWSRPAPAEGEGEE